MKLFGDDPEVDNEGAIHELHYGEVNPDLVLRATELFCRLPGFTEVAEHHRARTPERYVKMLLELTTREEIEFTTFPNTGIDEMVVLAPIPFYTLCAHHVVPFYGKAYIAYIPREDIAGLSKFGRTVKNLAKGFHVQEELTQEIANFLEEHLEPLGIAVVLKGEHMCVSMRGVQMPDMITTTSCMKGVFLDTTRGARAEFLQLIKD